MIIVASERTCKSPIVSSQRPRLETSLLRYASQVPTHTSVTDPPSNSPPSSFPFLSFQFSFPFSFTLKYRLSGWLGTSYVAYDWKPPFDSLLINRLSPGGVFEASIPQAVRCI